MAAVSECPICYTTTDIHFFLSGCIHGACRTCVERCHREHTSCPFCRTPFQDTTAHALAPVHPNVSTAHLELTEEARLSLHSRIVFDNIAPTAQEEMASLQPIGTVVPLGHRIAPLTLNDIVSDTFLRPFNRSPRNRIFVHITIRVRENTVSLWDLLRYFFASHTTTMAVCTVLEKRYATMKTIGYNGYTEGVKGSETAASKRRRAELSSQALLPSLELIEHNMVRPHLVGNDESAKVKSLEVKFTIRGESVAMWAHAMREIVLPGRSELDEDERWLCKLEQQKILKTRRLQKWTGYIW